VGPLDSLTTARKVVTRRDGKRGRDTSDGKVKRSYIHQLVSFVSLLK
jgi:hypothetical protein